MVQEGLLRFYALVVHHGIAELYTFDETELGKDLSIGKFERDDVSLDLGNVEEEEHYGIAQLYTIDETELGKDLSIGERDDVSLDLGNVEEKRLSVPQFPFKAAAAYCHVNRSLILAGGRLFTVSHNSVATNNVWSLDVAAAASGLPGPGRGCSTWSIRAKMHRRRENLLAVPYDGQIFIFGGERSSSGPPTLEIYDPKSGNLSEPKPLHEDLSSEVANPHPYFLWKDGSAPHKKPLIMMHYDHRVPPYQRLWSYNVEDGRLEVFDSDFPAFHSHVYLPLAGSNNLLIFDEPSSWSVYDMSSKKVTGRVFVLGLENYKVTMSVSHAFCRNCSDASVIVYIFIEQRDYADDFSDPYPYHLPCAKVRLRMDGGKFSATLESEVTLRIGQYREVYMFAEQATVEAAPDLGGQKAESNSGDAVVNSLSMLAL